MNLTRDSDLPLVVLPLSKLELPVKSIVRIYQLAKSIYVIIKRDN